MGDGKIDEGAKSAKTEIDTFVIIITTVTYIWRMGSKDKKGDGGIATAMITMMMTMMTPMMRYFIQEIGLCPSRDVNAISIPIASYFFLFDKKLFGECKE